MSIFLLRTEQFKRFLHKISKIMLINDINYILASGTITFTLIFSQSYRLTLSYMFTVSEFNNKNVLLPFVIIVYIRGRIDLIWTIGNN